jgi:hypothetical protein
MAGGVILQGDGCIVKSVSTFLAGDIMSGGRVVLFLVAAALVAAFFAGQIYIPYAGPIGTL